MLKLIPHVGLDESFNHALRTEDIRFSPSGRVLAVVATSGNIYLFAVDTTSRPIRVLRTAVLHSPSLASPHGIDFLDEHVVVVANRGGWLTFYRITDVNSWADNMTAELVHETGSTWFGDKGSTRPVKGRAVNCGPGSVRVHDHHLFVCCNNKSTLTAHPCTLKKRVIKVGDGEVVVQDGLEVPDGLALSRDGRWLAVGDHEFRRIMIICRGTEQSITCALCDADLCHPHGMCFDPTGKALYVADAGERAMHVFVTPDEWATTMSNSTFKLSAVEVDAFNKTKDSVDQRYRSLEGGIKGIDVDASGRIIATTCQNQMLRFFESNLASADKRAGGFWGVLNGIRKR